MSTWDRVIDNGIAESSNTRPKLPGVSNVTDAQLNAAGWYERMYLDAPEGHTATAYQWEGVIDGRSVYGVSASELIPIPEPYPTPDSLAPTMDADGTQIGVSRLFVDADGNVRGVIHSQSPARTDAEQRAAWAAMQAANTARLEAAGFTAAQVEVLRQFRDVDVDALFSEMTANQRKFLKVVQAAVVVQIKERVPEVNQ